MKSLTDDLIENIVQGDEFKALLPDGYHAIRGPGGYVLMPNELSVEEWKQQQDDGAHIKAKTEAEEIKAGLDNKRGRESNSLEEVRAKDPHDRNGAQDNAQIRDITAQAATEANIRADEKAFDELFPELEKG